MGVMTAEESRDEGSKKKEGMCNVAAVVFVSEYL
jgi:hypothetical protein